MDDDLNELSNDERRRKIDEIKAGMPYLLSRFGDGSEEVERARTEMAALEKASRDAKPYRTHRALLERRKLRLERQQERGKEEAEDLLNQVEKLQARLNEVNRANDEREKSITEVDEELRELLRKAIAEGDNEPPLAVLGPAIDPNDAWNTVSSTLHAFAARPGVPHDWAAQLGGLLEQLRIAATAVHQRAADSAGALPQPGAPTSATAAATVPSSLSTSPSTSCPSPPSATAGVTPPATATASWSDRALELAYAEGGGATVAGSPPAAAVSQPEPQPPAPAAGAADPKPPAAQTAAATAATAATAGSSTILASEEDSSDDDMASVVGEDFNLQEGETEQQRKLRIARHLRERREKRRELRRREARGDRKGKDASAGANTGKETNRVKPVHKKK